jgi:hypothetical protein
LLNSFNMVSLNFYDGAVNSMFVALYIWKKTCQFKHGLVGVVEVLFSLLGSYFAS